MWVCAYALLARLYDRLARGDGEHPAWPRDRWMAAPIGVAHRLHASIHPSTITDTSLVITSRSHTARLLTRCTQAGLLPFPLNTLNCCMLLLHIIRPKDLCCMCSSGGGG